MSLTTLIMILCTLESSNNPNAIGDGGQAVGVLQIHTIMVRECNRIAGKRVFYYDDRRDSLKSKAMAVTFLSRRIRDARKLTEKEIEDCVKAWNGGGSWKRGDFAKQERLNIYFKKFKGIVKWN